MKIEVMSVSFDNEGQPIITVGPQAPPILDLLARDREDQESPRADDRKAQDKSGAGS